MFKSLINKIKGTKSVTLAPIPVLDQGWDEDADDFSDAEWDAAIDAAWSESTDLPVGDAYAGAEV